MKWLLLVAGSALIALCIVGVVMAERTVGDLASQWRAPASDSSYWNGFMQDHLTLWLIKFCGVALMVFGIPGIVLLKLGLKSKPVGQLWKRDGDWGEWR